MNKLLDKLVIPVVVALVAGAILLFLEYRTSLFGETVPAQTPTNIQAIKPPATTANEPVRLPTSTPSTSTTEWPAFQDDFSKIEYDGKYNQSLWSAQFQPNCGKAEQRDGVLMLTAPESCPEGSLYMWTVDGFSSIEHIKSAEAKLMLSSDFKGRGGPTFGFSANAPAWGNGCFIRAFDDGRGALAICEAWTYGTGHRTVYRSDEIAVSYDKWYSFKIVTDPKEMKITYYLDSQVIGSYKPIDDAPGLREAPFYAGVDVEHGANSRVTGYIDDVRFGP